MQGTLHLQNQNKRLEEAILFLKAGKLRTSKLTAFLFCIANVEEFSVTQ